MYYVLNDLNQRYKTHYEKSSIEEKNQYFPFVNGKKQPSPSFNSSCNDEISKYFQKKIYQNKFIQVDFLCDPDRDNFERFKQIAKEIFPQLCNPIEKTFTNVYRKKVEDIIKQKISLKYFIIKMKNLDS